MLEQKETGKWELILDDLENERIIQTGYTSSDADVMIKFLGYLNQGVKSDIPDRIIKDFFCCSNLNNFAKIHYCNSIRKIFYNTQIM